MNKIVLCVLSCWLSVGAFDQSVNYLQSYIWANYHCFNKNYTQAGTHFTYLLEHDAPPQIYLGYLHYLFNTQRYAEITELAPTIDSLYPTQQDIQLLITHAFQLTGEHEQASKRYIALFEHHKYNADIAYQVASLYLHRKDFEAALRTIDIYLQETPHGPHTFLFHFLKSKIYVVYNDPKKALMHIKKSLELQPRFDKGWLVVAALDEENGALENAINGYTQFLALTSGTHPEIEQHIAQLTFKQKYTAHTTTYATTLYSHALQAFEEKKYTQAEQYIIEFLQYQPTDIQGRLLQIQILVELNAIEQAAEVIMQAITRDVDNEVWYQTLHMLTHTTLSYNKAIALLKKSTKSSQALLPALYLADLYMRNSDYTHALVWLDKAEERTSDTLLKTKLLFHKGHILYQQQDYTTARKTVERGYALGCAFAPLYNLLAYCYYQIDDTERALEIVEKALTLDPENPHYIDTKICILYKQGHTEEAHSLAQTVLSGHPCTTERIHNVYTFTVQTSDIPRITPASHDISHDLSAVH